LGLDRDPVPLADLPVFGWPVELVWRKRRWRCPEPGCPVGSWTEDRPDIALARAAMTSRAGQWATREVGAEVHTVTYAAAQLGVAWRTVTDAVVYWGQALIEDPDRIGVTEAVGVDETKRLAARRRRPTRWISAICDVARRIVIDVIEGRDGRRVEAWLAERPRPGAMPSWRRPGQAAGPAGRRRPPLRGPRGMAGQGSPR
jgi:transposase